MQSKGMPCSEREKELREEVLRLQERIRRMEAEREAAISRNEEAGAPQQNGESSEGKQTAQELCFFKHLVECSSDPFFIISPAADYRLIYVNSAASRHLGRSREELLTMSIPDWDPMFTMAQIPPMWDELRQKKSIIFETLHRHADGHVIPVEVSTNYFVFDGQELFGGWFHDISRRKETERQLRCLAATVENSNDFIGLCTPDMIPFYINEAGRRMVGLEAAQDVRQTSVIDFFWPEERARIESHVLPAFLQKGVWSGELRLRHFKTGQPIDTLWSAFVIKDPGGGADTWATLCMDLTGIRNLEAERRAADEANRAKSEFLANMSHEIRTPMTVFLAALDYLLKIDQDPRRRALLEMAENSGQRLRALIDEILDISRIEARRVQLQQEPFILRECVRNAVELLRLSAEEKHLPLELAVAPEVPEIVVGDPDRLGQILTNLVGNAVKFTERGEVRVAVAHRDRTLRFAVSDTGIGIPEEKRALLFQTFSQVDSSLTRKHGGTGLGLAICKGLVDLMGGRIWMEERPGGGSSFFFTVPLADEKGRPRVSPRGSRGGSLPLSAVRILLVEDDPVVREMLLLLLGTRDWQVETAESGPEGIGKWREGAFDLVLMDVQMPEMSGLEATREIRRLEVERGGHTCIAGLTAHARPEIREDCLKAGMDYFLTKPIRMDELVQTLEQCIAGREDQTP